MPGVRTARKMVQLASNSKKLKKKQERLMLSGPYPRFLMDPDLHNASGALDWSRSIWIQIKRLRTRESGPGLGQPGSRAYIKGVTTRFLHFSKRFSFFFSSSPPFSL